jgi:predicted metal-binding protein
MAKHILVVCEDCGFSANQHKHEGQAGGIHLLNQLKPLYENWSRKSELEIQTVGCLCACDRPCTIGLTGTSKITYLFGDLPPLESAADLLTLGELYIDSEDGYILPAKMPKLLRDRRFARIPPAPPN